MSPLTGNSSDSNTPVNTDFILGQILTKITAMERGIERVEEYDQRIQSIEKDIVSVSKDFESIKGDLVEIKQFVEKPKTPWWTYAAGIAGITAIVLGFVSVINIIVGNGQ